MKQLGKRPTSNVIQIVARGCYCGAICSCHNTNSTVVKKAYGAVKAASWSSADVDL